jgi:hypothetical protein
MPMRVNRQRSVGPLIKTAALVTAGCASESPPNNAIALFGAMAKKRDDSGMQAKLIGDAAASLEAQPNFGHRL